MREEGDIEQATEVKLPHLSHGNFNLDKCVRIKHTYITILS